MEFFRPKPESPDAPEAEVEIFDQHVSNDGTRVNYSVRRPDGSVRHLAIPTTSLDVMFTSEGIVQLPHDTDENH